MKRISAIIGTLLMFSAISTSDFYSMEVIQETPTYVWYMLGIGFAMVIVPLMQAVWAEFKGDKYDDVHR